MADEPGSPGGRIGEGEVSVPLPTPVGVIRVDWAVTILAPAARVFQALTEEIGAWWGPPYSCTDRPKGMVLEARLGGRFYEMGDDGEECLWGTVSTIRPGASLELTGPCGTAGAVYGVFGFQLKSQGPQTVLRISHQAIGDVGPDTQAGYVEAWKDLLGNRLKLFVEKGVRLGVER